MNIENIIPKDLVGYNLVDSLMKLKGGINSEGSQVTKDSLLQTNLNIALEEFIDMVQFSESLHDKDYVVSRLLRLRSSKRLLQEISNYLPINFDFSIDLKDGLPKTNYTPRLLKVTMENISLSEVSVDYLDIIDRMFNNLLYFLEYELSITNLIYKINSDLNKERVSTDIIPIRYIDLNTTYFND